MEHLIKSIEVYDTIYKYKINTIKFDSPNNFNEKTYNHNTSLNSPFVLSTEVKKNGNTIYINPEFYKKNKKMIVRLIEETLKKTSQEYIYLDAEELVKKNFLNAIIENKNIKKVKLNKFAFLNPKQMRALMNSGIQSLICSASFNNIKEFLNCYTSGVEINGFVTFTGIMLYNFGSDTLKLTVLNHLTKHQLKCLKNVFDKFPQNRVLINLGGSVQKKEILDAVSCKEVIIRNDKNYRKEDYEFFEKNSEDISFEITTDLWTSAKRLKEKEIIFDIIINEVKSKSLTPLESYMYLYNTVKLFKEYQEVPHGLDLMLSRRSEFTLFNNYMVCVGYTNLLEELVDRLDDPNLIVVEYGCKVKSDNGAGKHSRCLVKIKDDAYGINGTYISDPTWDAVKYYYDYIDENGEEVVRSDISLAHIDLYNHFLMTYEETKDKEQTVLPGDVTGVFFNNEVISSENSYEVFNITKKFVQKKEVTNQDVEDQIAATVQPNISCDVLVSAIKRLYSTVFYNNDDTIQTLVDNTIKHNNSYQEEHFDETRHKFNKVLKKTF